MRFAIVSEIELDSGKRRCAMRSSRPRRGFSRGAFEAEPENASKGEEAPRNTGVVRC